jgi:thioesterase domain-containing protein
MSVDNSEVEEARRRLTEETKKIAVQVEAERKAIIDARLEHGEKVGDRKQHIAQDHKRYAELADKVKNKELDTASLQEGTDLEARKRALEEERKRIAEKGVLKKHEGAVAHIDESLQKKFDSPTAAAKPTISKGSSTNAKVVDLTPKNWDGKYYSLVNLRQRRVEGVDKHNREQYLSPQDFEAAFGMTKEDFARCPKWKRDKLKGGLYLF